ncbi:MAG TPA: DUF5916 domain-containing protein [Gemmatimonadaceae bacterium]|nr:DUF5916 domain-containing protein [Gemmatimonadaceae bacterium]
MRLSTLLIAVPVFMSLAARRAWSQRVRPVTGVSHTDAPEHSATSAHLLRAVRVAAPPVIDGRLDEAAWATAPEATSFVQQRPDPGAAGTERTTARVLYDDHAIYVGMRMYTTDTATIASAVARRDYTGYSDWAQVMFDSHHDRRTAFRFAVNPAGVQKDALEYDDGQGEDVSWDGVWEAAAHIDSLGWTAEFRIPLSQLRFNASDSTQVWGVDFIRDIARLNERDYWAPIPPDASKFVSAFGELVDLRDLRAPRRLEVLPYTLASVTNAPGVAGNPFLTQNDLGTKLGADIKYGLTGDLTLTGTANPDFGQVEADPSVVNLTAFETFFPEKRPFFIEGADLFQFNIGFPYSLGFNFGNDQPFYSRRVGRAPEGSVPDSAAQSDVPEATTILGAAKLSGKTASGWSIGMLDAVTQRELARYTGPASERLDVPVEPLTNYTVARVRKDFREGQSAVGGIFTATDRRITSLALGNLPTFAYTAGLDARHRFGGGNYEASVSTLGTLVRGDAQAIAAIQTSPGHYYQRPDASYLTYDSTRTVLGGFATSAKLDKIGGGHWRWTVATHARSPGFDMNDLGFEQSTDWLLEGANLGYVDFEPSRHVLSWSVNLSELSGWSFGGERRATGGALNGSVNLVNNWGVSVNVGRSFSALSTDLLRGGPALRTPAMDFLDFSMNTDARKPVNVQLFGDVEGEPETGRHDGEISPILNVRPSGRWEFSLGPDLSWNVNPWQYVTQRPALGATQYLFGRIKQTTAALTLRARYSFTPTLSVQLYGEPFVSAGDYSAFKRVTNARAGSFDDRFHTFTPAELSYAGSTGNYQVDVNSDGTTDLTFGNPNFNIQQFRSTAVLRWEYRPGSTLFVVWQQGRSQFAPTGAFDLAHDARTLFRAPATNVLLIKLNYWLDY